MSFTEITIIVMAVVVGLAAVAAWLWWRHHSLRARFGPEYDRVASEQDSRLAVDRQLRARERRHAQLELHPLDPVSHDKYASAWTGIEARFVDEPGEAICAAEALVVQLIAERGYPTADYEGQLAQLSVDHAPILGHYRDAHDTYLRHERGEATTEQLRQALVHYRALFADLLGEEPAGPEGVNRHHLNTSANVVRG
jgi:hypothetical protein